jgi:hypothetical protein
MRTRLFIIGFFLGIALFVGANIYSYQALAPPCCDFFASFGFPLRLGNYGGFVGHTVIDLAGLIGDALIGICAGLLIAWAFVKLFAAKDARSTQGQG